MMEKTLCDEISEQDKELIRCLCVASHELDREIGWWSFRYPTGEVGMQKPRLGGKNFIWLGKFRNPYSRVPFHCHPRDEPKPSISDMLSALIGDYPEDRFCIATRWRVVCYKKGPAFEEFSPRAKELAKKIDDFKRRLREKGKRRSTTREEMIEEIDLKYERFFLERDVERRIDEVFQKECEF